MKKLFLIFLIPFYTLFASELYDNSNIVDIYYDSGVSSIDIAIKDRYFVQPILEVAEAMNTYTPRIIQQTACFESENMESCPINAQKCNVSLVYDHGTSERFKKTIQRHKYCSIGVFSEYEKSCVSSSFCNNDNSFVSEVDGKKYCKSSDDIISTPSCLDPGQVLNDDNTLCKISLSCPSGYIDTGDMCELNYFFYSYKCPDSSDGNLWVGPLDAGDDCLGLCPGGVYDGCYCNDEAAPANNCKNIIGSCPIDTSLPCVAVPSESGDFTLDIETYIYAPLVDRFVIGGYNAASVNENTDICLNDPCPYTIKHIVANGNKLEFAEEYVPDVMQYVEVSGNNFSGEINGDISYLVVSSDHLSFSGYNSDNQLLGTIYSNFRINGKVGFLDSIGFNVVTTEDVDGDGRRNTLFFYNTFSNQHKEQGFLTFVSEMDPSLADCVTNEQDIQQSCPLGILDNEGRCVALMQDNFCNDPYQLINDPEYGERCVNSKVCDFGEFVKKQDDTTRLCSDVITHTEDCPYGETLNENGECQYVQNRCRDDYEYLIAKDSCMKTLYSPIVSCKTGYALSSIDENSSTAECLQEVVCENGVFTNNIDDTNKICTVDDIHIEVCPNAETLIEKDGVSYCSYTKNLCENGYTYNINSNICFKEIYEQPINSCENDREFIDNGSGTGLCIEKTNCISGNWVENISDTQRKCHTDSLYNEDCPSGDILNEQGSCEYSQNKCTYPLVYSLETGKCEQNVFTEADLSCKTNYNYIDFNQSNILCVESTSCESGIYVRNISDTQRECKIIDSYSETTQNGYSIDLNSGQFFIETPLCAENETYNAIEKRCESSAVISCSDPEYLYNQDTQRCEKSFTCDSGSVWNSSTKMCESEPIRVCDISGYVLNTSTDQCERAPQCDSNLTYNINTKKCENFNDGYSLTHTGAVDDYTDLIALGADQSVSFPFNSLVYAEEENAYFIVAEGEYYINKTGTKIAIGVSGDILEGSGANDARVIESFSVDGDYIELLDPSPQSSNAGEIIINYSDYTLDFIDKYGNSIIRFNIFDGSSSSGRINNFYGTDTYLYFNGTELQIDSGLDGNDYVVSFDIGCPSGYIVDTEKNLCVKNVQFNFYSFLCDSGYTVNDYGAINVTREDPDFHVENESELSLAYNSNTPPLNNCSLVKDPFCDSSVDIQAIFDGDRDMCYFDYASSMCTDGIYNATLDKCQKDPICENGEYDALNGVCFSQAITNCTSGFADNLCIDAPADCSSFVYKNENFSFVSNNILRCEENIDAVCSLEGYIFSGTVDSLTRRCENVGSIIETCPSGEVVDAFGFCNYSKVKCSDGYSFDSDSQSCQKTLISPTLQTCRLGYDYFDQGQESLIGKCIENNASVCSVSATDIFVGKIDNDTRECLDRVVFYEDCLSGEVLNEQGLCVKEENDLCDSRVGDGFTFDLATLSCKKVLESSIDNICSSGYLFDENATTINGTTDCIKVSACDIGEFLGVDSNNSVQCLVQTEVIETCPSGEVLNSNGECVYDQRVCGIDYNYIALNDRCEKYIYEDPNTQCYKTDYLYDNKFDGTAICTSTQACNTGWYSQNIDEDTRECKESSFHSEVCQDGQEMDKNGQCYYELKNEQCPDGYTEQLVDNKVFCIESEICINNGLIGSFVYKINENTRQCHFNGQYSECSGEWDYENKDAYDILLSTNPNVGITKEIENNFFVATNDRVTQQECEELSNLYDYAIMSTGTFDIDTNLREMLLFDYESYNQFAQPFCAKGEYSSVDDTCQYCPVSSLKDRDKCISCPPNTAMINYDELYYNGSISDSRQIIGYQTVSLDEDITFCRRYADYNGRSSASWKCVKGSEALTTDFVGGVDSNDDLDYRISIAGIDNEDITFCRRYADYNGRSSASWKCVKGSEALTTDFVGDVDGNDDLDYRISINKTAPVYTDFTCYYEPLDNFYEYWASKNYAQLPKKTNSELISEIDNTTPLNTVSCSSKIDALDFDCSIESNATRLTIGALNNNNEQIMKVRVIYIDSNDVILDKSYYVSNYFYSDMDPDAHNKKIVNFSIEMVRTVVETPLLYENMLTETPEYGKSYCVLQKPQPVGFKSTMMAKKKVEAQTYNYSCSDLLCVDHQCGVARCQDGFDPLINNDYNSSSGCVGDECDINLPFSPQCGKTEGCGSDDTIIMGESGECFKMVCDENSGFVFNPNEKTCDKYVCPEGFEIDNGDNTCAR